MNGKKLFLIVLIVLLYMPIVIVSAEKDTFSFQDKIHDTTSVFFLVALEKGEEIEVSVKPNGDGRFALFLFNERPVKSYVNMDGTLQKEIYEKAIIYDLSEEPYINYTAEKSQIYYIQVILLRNGPDIFTLESNKELTRYYLPAVPGYSVEILIFSLVSSIALSLIILKKKI
ncbi:MAG: hypothetical protein ACTSQJ_15950 [Promethearchaeota archaeon]